MLMLGAMIDIHYFAAARAARGQAQEALDPATVPGNTLGDLLDHLGATHAEGRAGGLSLAEIFDRCTFLVDGRNSAPDAPLPSPCRVDVLPPFAGG